jgi:hypothetical protein
VAIGIRFASDSPPEHFMIGHQSAATSSDEPTRRVDEQVMAGAMPAESCLLPLSSARSGS